MAGTTARSATPRDWHHVTFRKGSDATKASDSSLLTSEHNLGDL